MAKGETRDIGELVVSNIHKICLLLCLLMLISAFAGHWGPVVQILPSVLILYSLRYIPIIAADPDVRAAAFRNHRRDRRLIRWRDRPAFLDGVEREALRIERARRERLEEMRRAARSPQQRVISRPDVIGELAASLEWADKEGVREEEPRNYKVLRKVEAHLRDGNDAAAVRLLGVARDNARQEPLLGHAARRILEYLGRA